MDLILPQAIDMTTFLMKIIANHLVSEYFKTYFYLNLVWLFDLQLALLKLFCFFLMALRKSHRYQFLKN